jgi:hypothetical protein
VSPAARVPVVEIEPAVNNPERLSELKVCEPDNPIVTLLLVTVVVTPPAPSNVIESFNKLTKSVPVSPSLPSVNEPSEADVVLDYIKNTEEQASLLDSVLNNLHLNKE